MQHCITKVCDLRDLLLKGLTSFGRKCGCYVILKLRSTVSQVGDTKFEVENVGPMILPEGGDIFILDFVLGCVCAYEGVV